MAPSQEESIEDKQHETSADGGDGVAESTESRTATRMEHAVEQIRGYVIEHSLDPGDRLPPERKMAELFGVSRTAIRDAIKTLYGLGVVDVKNRAGVFLSKGGSGSTPLNLSGQFYMHDTSIRSLIEVRTTLESATSELAAERCDAADAAALRLLVEENHRCLDTRDGVERFRSVDRRLHLAIARIAANPVLFDLLRTLFRYLQVYKELVDVNRDVIVWCANEHTNLVEAIIAKDPERARVTMAKHLRSVYEKFSKTLSGSKAV